MINNFPYMKIALDEAKNAYSREEVPVGAVIISNADNIIIAQNGNRVEELSDPTAHAELLVIKEACRKLENKFLNDCTLYVTLEPCPMCAQAISFARIKTIFYGAEDIKSGGVDNGAKIYKQSSCNHKPDYYSGIMEKESSRILKDFFKERR